MNTMPFVTGPLVGTDNQRRLKSRRYQSSTKYSNRTFLAGLILVGVIGTPLAADKTPSQAPTPIPIKAQQCEPIDNPFPVPVPIAPMSEQLPEMRILQKLFALLWLTHGSIQTAPAC